ncbi:MAG TPA: DUF3467 domain-containing protein [Patescibacteria group bacterium]|nr:DUF3467 domain-containing protein [Patescibacteria group bacterium]
MDDDDQQEQKINFTMNPDQTPLYMADGYLITSNEHIVSFNFFQDFPGGSNKNIVARVALTRAQAKEFLKNLNDHIEKFEV